MNFSSWNAKTFAASRISNVRTFRSSSPKHILKNFWYFGLLSWENKIFDIFPLESFLNIQFNIWFIKYSAIYFKPKTEWLKGNVHLHQFDRYHILWGTERIQWMQWSLRAASHPCCQYEHDLGEEAFVHTVAQIIPFVWFPHKTQPSAMDTINISRYNLHIFSASHRWLLR